MQFYFRTGRNTGVSLGPLGLLIVGPIYLAVLVFLAFVYLIALAILFLVGLYERRRDTIRG